MCPSKAVKLLDMNGVMLTLEAVALVPGCNIIDAFEEGGTLFEHEVVSCRLGIYSNRED